MTSVHKHERKCETMVWPHGCVCVNTRVGKIAYVPGYCCEEATFQALTRFVVLQAPNRSTPLPRDRLWPT